jgi:CRP-like cAMP-binding protein
MPALDHIRMDIKREEADLFPTLSQDEVTSIYQEIRVFDTGQSVFSEADEGDGAYYIIEGHVKIVVRSHDFKEILLGELGAGEIFGEMALIDAKARSASVVTLTQCKIAFIAKKPFNEFIEARSDLAFRFMGFTCLSLFRHILRLDRLYSDIKKKGNAS